MASFNLDDFNDGDLEHNAEALLSMSANPKLKARIVMPEETAPLVTWNKTDGWREWRIPV